MKTKRRITAQTQRFTHSDVAIERFDAIAKGWLLKKKKEKSLDSLPSSQATRFSVDAKMDFDTA